MVTLVVLLTMPSQGGALIVPLENAAEVRTLGSMLRKPTQVQVLIVFFKIPVLVVFLRIPTDTQFLVIPSRKLTQISVKAQANVAPWLNGGGAGRGGTTET